MTASGRRALVVDDNETVRDLVCQILESCGFDLVVAADGAEALQPFTVSELVALVERVMPPAGG